MVKPPEKNPDDVDKVPDNMTISGFAKLGARRDAIYGKEGSDGEDDSSSSSSESWMSSSRTSKTTESVPGSVPDSGLRPAPSATKPETDWTVGAYGNKTVNPITLSGISRAKKRLGKPKTNPVAGVNNRGGKHARNKSTVNPDMFGQLMKNIRFDDKGSSERDDSEWDDSE